MSWEGHLSGLLTGIMFALIFRKHIPKPHKYVWEREDYNEEHDEFLKHFDEDGNFRERIESDTDQEDQEDTPIIRYTYKKNKD